MQRLASLHMLLHHLGKYKALEPEQQFIALEEIKNFHNITLEGLFVCLFVCLFVSIFVSLSLLSKSQLFCNISAIVKCKTTTKIFLISGDLGCAYIDAFVLLYSWQKCDSRNKPEMVDSIKYVFFLPVYSS